jgi:fatty-acyl-CoA synthase
VSDAAFWPRNDEVAVVDHTVGGLLAARAASHPDTTAIIGVRHGGDEQVRLTYRELFDEAARVATALSRLAERGSFVAIWAPNVIDWSIIQYGAALAGVVLVALNPALREPELEYALAHSGASVLLFAESARGHAMTATVGSVAAKLPDLRYVSLSQRGNWQAADIDQGVLDGAPDDPDDVVMLQYTSGTTGKPKGVLLRHRSLINIAKLTLEAADVPAGAVCLNPLPLFHTAGCVIATLGPLWIAGTVVLVEQFRPEPVLQMLSDEHVSVLFHVPAVLGALSRAQQASCSPAPHLTTIMGGAATVPAAMIESAERIFGATVINLFGQTELSPVLSATRPGDSRKDQLTTVGRPLPQIDCKVVDLQTNEVVSVGQSGEICARGIGQFIGYLHDPEATSQTVDGEGFVHTGDLGRMDSRGYLSVTGRLKDLIIRGGENIAPVEIETALVEHGSVIGAAVIGLPDDRWGEIVAAVVCVGGDHGPGLKADIVVS